MQPPHGLQMQTNQQKWIFLLAKKVFMSKVLDSRSNDLERFERYKVDQWIPHEISIKMAVESH